MRSRRKSERDKPQIDGEAETGALPAPASEHAGPETPVAAAAPAGGAESGEAVPAPAVAREADAPEPAASLVPAAPADAACAGPAGDAHAGAAQRVNWDDEPAPALTARLGGYARRYGLYAAGFLMAAGLGWAAGSSLLSHGPDAKAPGPAGAARTAALPTPPAKAAGGQPARPASDQDGAATRPAADAAVLKDVRALKERIERSERELAAKLDAVAGRLGQLSRPESDPKLNQVLERLERIERQIASASASAPAVQPAAAVVPAAQPAAQPAGADAKALSKPTLEGWLVRGVHDGVAWVEGRNGVIHEVALGQNIPGAGRVEAIQRRGRDWIVVTSRGVIVEE